MYDDPHKRSMSWITTIWSTVASACLTLALIHFHIWVRDRQRYAYLLFSVSALGAALTGFFDLLTLQAQSVIPEALLAIAMGWLIRIYSQAGRHWILMAITALWTLLLLSASFRRTRSNSDKSLGSTKAPPFWARGLRGQRVSPIPGDISATQHQRSWWYS